MIWFKLQTPEAYPGNLLTMSDIYTVKAKT